MSPGGRWQDHCPVFRMNWGLSHWATGTCKGETCRKQREFEVGALTVQGCRFSTSDTWVGWLNTRSRRIWWIGGSGKKVRWKFGKVGSFFEPPQMPAKLGFFTLPRKNGRRSHSVLCESAPFLHTAGNGLHMPCRSGCGRFGHKLRSIGKEPQRTGLISLDPAHFLPAVH